MHRQDYVKLAQVINETAKAAKMKIGQKIILVERMITMLAEDNPKFDVYKFRKACNDI